MHSPFHNFEHRLGSHEGPEKACAPRSSSGGQGRASIATPLSPEFPDPPSGLAYLMPLASNTKDLSF